MPGRMPASLQPEELPPCLSHLASQKPLWTPFARGVNWPLCWSEAEAHVSGAKVARTFTAFQSGDGHCEEGFRCVSRISKFGTGHWGQVDPGKEKIAEDANSAPVYEWGCPFQGEWTENRYESGPGDDQCTDDGDCICIARGSPNMHTELESGHEKVIGRFETESSKANLGHEPQLMTVIPHYFMRTKDGAPFDIENPHSGLGVVKEFDREEWLLKYKEEAPKIQGALDKLRAAIDAEYRSKVQDGAPFVCDGAQPPGEEPSLTKEQTQLGLMRVRRFQVLASDCVNMQDTAAKLAGRPEEESFAPSGKTEGGDELKCYKKKDSAECQQMNCYRGFEDQGFLDRLQLYKTQLDSCSPEEDTKTAEAAAGSVAKAPKTDKGAAGAAGAAPSPKEAEEAGLKEADVKEGGNTEEPTEATKPTEEPAEGKQQSVQPALLGAAFCHPGCAHKARRKHRRANFL